MQGLVFAPDRNTPGKKDATGAFLPEARAFLKQHDLSDDSLVLFDPTAPPSDRRRRVNNALAQRLELDVVAFFCHGYARGIQAGLQSTHLTDFATQLALRARRDLRVALYACDTGRDEDAQSADDREPGPGGDGGFADRLRDALEQRGLDAVVLGHATAGHTTYNPYMRRFVAGAGGIGGEWFVEPKTALWTRWVRALRAPRSTLRLRLPWMTPKDVQRELTAVA